MQHGLLRQKYTLKPSKLILRSASPDSLSMLNNDDKNVAKENNNAIVDGDKCEENSCRKTGSFSAIPMGPKVNNM